MDNSFESYEYFHQNYTICVICGQNILKNGEHICLEIIKLKLLSIESQIQSLFRNDLNSKDLNQNYFKDFSTENCGYIQRNRFKVSDKMMR